MQACLNQSNSVTCILFSGSRKLPRPSDYFRHWVKRSPVPLCDIFHSSHSYHCCHSSWYSCCCGYSRFSLATPNVSLNPCRRASGSLRSRWDRVSLGFAGYLRLLPCLASSGYWFGLIKGLMPFTLRLMPFSLLFTLSCLAREPNQDTPIKSS